MINAFNEFRDFEILSLIHRLLGRFLYTSIMVGKSKYKNILLKTAGDSIKRLLQQHHLPRLDEIASDNPVKIDSTSNRDSELIPAVPNFLVKTRLTVLFVPAHYFLSHYVIDYQHQVGLLWQSITDRSTWIERIGIVLR